MTQLERKLRAAALEDPLTGLANRRLFLDRLEAAPARAARTTPTGPRLRRSGAGDAGRDGIGVANSGGQTPQPDALLQAADAVLYLAKQAGKDRLENVADRLLASA